jgi:osmotically-inducible protein OsmY
MRLFDHVKRAGSAAAILALLATGALAQTRNDKPAGTENRPDSWVTLKTKLALLTSDDVSGTSINVDTRNGKVTLQGKVPTAAEKAKAEQVARTIEGVKEVANLIQVVPESREEAVEASDDQIKDQVDKTLQGDRFKGISVGSINAGVVVLKGETRSLESAVGAVEAVSKLPGVKRVVNEIRIDEQR